jgi:hypothetical protein
LSEGFLELKNPECLGVEVDGCIKSRVVMSEDSLTSNDIEFPRIEPDCEGRGVSGVFSRDCLTSNDLECWRIELGREVPGVFQDLLTSNDFERLAVELAWEVRGVFDLERRFCKYASFVRSSSRKIKPGFIPSLPIFSSIR